MTPSSPTNFALLCDFYLGGSPHVISASILIGIQSKHENRIVAHGGQVHLHSKVRTDQGPELSLIGLAAGDAMWLSSQFCSWTTI